MRYIQIDYSDRPNNLKSRITKVWKYLAKFDLPGNHTLPFSHYKNERIFIKLFRNSISASIFKFSEFSHFKIERKNIQTSQ